MLVVKNQNGVCPQELTAVIRKDYEQGPFTLMVMFCTLIWVCFLLRCVIFFSNSFIRLLDPNIKIKEEILHLLHILS